MWRLKISRNVISGGEPALSEGSLTNIGGLIALTVDEDSLAYALILLFGYVLELPVEELDLEDQSGIGGNLGRRAYLAVGQFGGDRKSRHFRPLHGSDGQIPSVDHLFGAHSERELFVAVTG